MCGSGGQFRERAEITPDQREKFLQRYQQVQQGQSNILGMPPLAGGKQYLPQQQGPLGQQFNAQGPSASPQLGSLGIGLQASGPNSLMMSTSLQQQQLQSAVPQSPIKQTVMPTTAKDAETGLIKIEELQQQQSLPEDLSADSGSNSELGKNLLQEDEIKSSFAMDVAAAVAASSLSEPSQATRETGQPFQTVSSYGNLGTIGKKSVSDLGTFGDIISPSSSTSNSGGMHDQLYNLQMLEAAFHRLPHPKDSERAKNFTPRRPAVTPSSYPQVQAPIVSNPAFWERLGSDTYGTDSLFFAFYYQQNTYQQYLAAKNLKKQAWRYHTKYNTWFQRHMEPKLATDDFEQGTYVYFDFHIANDEQNGWCQRIKTDFAFEYNFLEDELAV